MIKELIEILNSDDFYDGDDTIQFAKGKYKGITNFKELTRWLRR